MALDHEEHASEVGEITVEELIPRLSASEPGLAVIDVRAAGEYSGGHIRGADHVCSEALLDDGSGATLGAELLSRHMAAGARALIVVCMYSSGRGPWVGQKLLGLVPDAGSDVKISVLQGGFHRFLNVAMPSAGSTSDLIESFEVDKWRRTETHGLVEANAVEGLEELSKNIPALPRPMALDHEEHASEVGEITVEELIPRLSASEPGLVVIDVRTDGEYSGGHIRGADHVCSEALLDDGSGASLGAELLSRHMAAGAREIIVVCMYSSDRGPWVGKKLLGLVPDSGSDVKISVLQGGFHRFLNVAMPSAGSTSELIESFEAEKWRRTETHGLVEANAVEGLEELLAERSP
jgi:rhodanese-related sulfurtransferase